jgi:hypothetical protein
MTIQILSGQVSIAHKMQVMVHSWGIKLGLLLSFELYSKLEYELFVLKALDPQCVLPLPPSSPFVSFLGVL